MDFKRNEGGVHADGKYKMGFDCVVEVVVIVLDQFHLCDGIVNVDIDDTIAQVELIQNYHNDFDDAIETHFIFPVSVDAAFVSLEVHLRDRIIKSVVKEKEQAKLEYE